MDLGKNTSKGDEAEDEDKKKEINSVHKYRPPRGNVASYPLVHSYRQVGSGEAWGLEGYPWRR